MSGNRVLKIQIIGDGKSAQKSVRDTADSMDGLEKSSRKAGDSIEDATDKAEKFGDRIKVSAKDADRSIKGLSFDAVSKDIEKAQRKVQALQILFADTGNTDLFKDIRKAESVVRSLERVKKGIAGIDAEGARSAGGLVSSFGNAFGTIASNATGVISKSLGDAIAAAGPEVQVALGAVIIGAAASASGIVAGAIGAAVMGGVGIGGIIGGVALAAQSPAIQDAARGTGQMFLQVFGDAAKGMHEPVLRALLVVQNGIQRLGPKVRGIFDKLAVYVEPLTNSFVKFIENMMPGIDAIASNLGPVMQELASWGPKLGTVFSDFFTLLASNATNNAAALHDLFTVFTWAVTAIGYTINALSNTWMVIKEIGSALKTAAEWADKLFFFLDPGGSDAGADSLGTFSSHIADVASGAQAAVPPMSVLHSVTASTGKAAAEAATQISIMDTAIGKLSGANINAEQAQIRVREAIRSAKKALEENHQTTKRGTKAWDDNRAKLLAVAEATKVSFDATFAQTHSMSKAIAVSDAGRASFIRLAKSMFGNSVNAKQLADDMIKIPSVNPKVTAHTAGAKRDIADIAAQLHAIPDESVNVSVYYHPNKSALIAKGTYATGGYVSGAGTGTSDSIPAMLSDGEYVIPANRVSALGLPFLEALRAGEPVSKYAKGGKVTGKSHPVKYARDGKVSGGFRNFVRLTGKKRLTGSMDSLNTASAYILDNVTGALDKSMRKSLGKLKWYAKQREIVAGKLKAAKERLADAIAKRNDYRDSVKSAAIQAGNITAGNDEITNSSLVLDKLRQQLEKTKRFRALVAQLQKMGINGTSYRQIVDAGVDGGMATAEALVAGGKGAVTELNGLQGQLNKAAAGLGYDASKRLYQAGVDSAQGLVNGLNSKARVLEAASKRLADSIIKKLRTVLKIKSPSRVLADQVGAYLPAGIAMGIDRNAHMVTDSLRKSIPVGGLADAAVRGSAARTAAGGGVTVHVHVAGNVLAEKQLAESIAPAVRDAIVRKGRNNGGRTGF